MLWPLLPFPHLAGDVSQPPLPHTRHSKSIEVAEDLDAMAAPTFAPARRRRELRAGPGRHGHAPPRLADLLGRLISYRCPSTPPQGAAGGTPGRRLAHLPGG
jgi:hypothetical protein